MALMKRGKQSLIKPLLRLAHPALKSSFGGVIGIAHAPVSLHRRVSSWARKARLDCRLHAENGVRLSRYSITRRRTYGVRHRLQKPGRDDEEVDVGRGATGGG
jgi:hypothetical protein